MAAKKWTEFVVGIIMILSPWVLGFSDISVAKWCNVLVGLFLVLVNVWALGSERPPAVAPAMEDDEAKNETRKRINNRKEGRSDINH